MSQHQAVMSRRGFLALAGTAVLAGVLDACAPAASTPEPKKPGDASGQVSEPTKAVVTPAAAAVTISYAFHDDPIPREDSRKLFTEKYPNIKVDLQQVTGDFPTKILTMAAGGTLPDVVRMWEALVIDMGKAGQVIDLNPYIQAESGFDPDDFLPVFWNFPVAGGKRFGVADAAATHFTFYNKELFDQAGVPYPDPKEFTWDKYVETARKTTMPSKDIFGSDPIAVSWVDWSWKLIWQNGGDIYNADYTKCLLDQPEAIEAIQYWADLQKEAKIMPPPDYVTKAADFGGDLFQARKVAMQRTGIWVAPALVTGGYKFDIVPEPYKKAPATIVHTAYNGISSKSKAQDAAWKWVNHWVSTDSMYIYSHFASFPGARKSCNARKPWSIEGAGENWDMIPQSLEYAHPLPGPHNDGEAHKLIGDALDAIYSGKKTAQEAFTEVAPKVTEVITKS